jgi:hypothetical protein
MRNGKYWKQKGLNKNENQSFAKLQECAKEDIGSKWVQTRMKSKVESSMHLLFAASSLNTLKM